MPNDLLTVLRDPARLAALHSLRLLDSPAEAVLDHLVHFAAAMLQTPIALVSLVDEDRQFFKSCLGLPEPWRTLRQIPLSHSFCQYAVQTGEPLVVHDARQHRLLCTNPAVRDLGWVAYLGSPLITADGVAIGTFCVIDTVPRVWTQDDVEDLRRLATTVMAEIEPHQQQGVVQDQTPEQTAELLPATDTLTTAPLSTWGDKVSVLLVDDHPEALQLLEATLMGMDLHLVKVTSGREALRQCLRQTFAMLFLDVRMPELDGYTTATLLRAHRPCQRTPIIFMTAYTPEDLEKVYGRLLGAADYVHKPVHPAVVRSKVATYVALFRQRVQLEQQAAQLLAVNQTLEERVQERTMALQQTLNALQAEITQRQQVEAALRTARDALETRVAERTAELARSNAELEQFAYVASHDLQEPLRAVAGCVQLLQQRYHARFDAHANDLMAHAVMGATRMQTLINDLLAYARVSTRGKPVEPVDCAVILKEVQAKLAAAIRESQAVITHEALPTVLADPTQLTQVFQNLIGNALKFCSAHPPEVHIQVERNVGEWVFTVRDNGIGIEPQYFERIFQMFQRLHTQQAYPGTGMGLAMCQKIVERHGGRIWVTSQPGRGATFAFTLPDRR